MADVNDKFIIEIGEKYKTADVACGTEAGSSPLVLYRVKGFNSLVFDDYGLKKLEKYEGDVNEQLLKSATDAAYERGWNDCTSKALSEDANAYDRGYNAGLLVSKAQSYEEGLKEGLEKGQKEFHMYDYQAGLDKAWAAVKLLLSREDRQEYNHEFDGLTAQEIICLFPVDEVVNRLENALKVPRPCLCIGDEVRYKGDPPSKPFVVTRISVESNDCFVDGIYDNGGILEDGKFSLMEKTGRHFPVADLLKQMEANNE